MVRWGKAAPLAVLAAQFRLGSGAVGLSAATAQDFVGLAAYDAMKNSQTHFFAPPPSTKGFPVDADWQKPGTLVTVSRAEANWPKSVSHQKQQRGQTGRQFCFITLCSRSQAW